MEEAIKIYEKTKFIGNPALLLFIYKLSSVIPS